MGLRKQDMRKLQNKKEKTSTFLWRFMLALPIFTSSRPLTIVGADELNFCVRDGNRWTLIAINTNYLLITNRFP